MFELLIHQITLFILMLGMPYWIFHYAKDVVKPKRKYNGKIDWILLALNIVIASMMVWSFILYVVPAFAHYVMLITVRNLPPISLAADVIFLSVTAICLTIFGLKRWSRKRRQAGRLGRS